eukprot:1005932-Rhodomonas_salina.2
MASMVAMTTASVLWSTLVLVSASESTSTHSAESAPASSESARVRHRQSTDTAQETKKATARARQSIRKPTEEDQMTTEQAGMPKTRRRERRRELRHGIIVECGPGLLEGIATKPRPAGYVQT